MAATDPTKVESLANIRNFCECGTSKNDFLTEARKNVVAKIEAILQTVLTTNDYTHRLDGHGDDILQAKAYPITAVDSIKDGYGTDLELEEADTGDDADKDYYIPDKLIVAGAEPYNGTIIMLHGAEWEEGEGNYIVTYTAGFTPGDEEGAMECPEIIKTAVKEWIKVLVQSDNIESKKMGDISYKFVTKNGVSVPAKVMNMLLRIAPPKIAFS